MRIRNSVMQGLLAAWVIAAIGTLGAAAQWTETKLVNLDPQIPYAGDWYATQGAISGNTVVIGQRFDIADPDTAKGVGGVKVFTRDGLGNWSYQIDLADLLLPGELVNAGEFGGGGLAIEGDTVLVGGYRNTVNGQTQAGRAYVFKRTGATWAYQATLESPLPAAGSMFGLGADLSGNLAIIGQYAGDMAHIFKKTDGVWRLVTTLTDPNPGGTYKAFGYGVSIDGNVAAVGDQAIDSVTIYRYQPGYDTWSQEQVLSVDAGSLFGTKLDLQGDTLVVAARQYKVTGTTALDGAAFVYRHDGMQWILEQRIDNPDPAASGLFGHCVALDGDTLIIGNSEDDDAGAKAGSAYVYRRTGSTWEQVGKFVASDGVAGKTLGEVVDVSGDTFLAGGPGRSTSPTGNGDAYVFTLSDVQPPHPGDANGDGKVDDLDASILAANWQRTGDATWALADFNGDTNVNDLDASILAANWQYGVGAAVPEPSLLVLLLGGLAVLAARRRR